MSTDIVNCQVVIACRGRSRGGAWGAHAPPPPPPPFGTEQALNVEVYRAHIAHISIRITASCPANIKHSNLQLSRDTSVAVPRIQWPIPKGRCSETRPYVESTELYTLRGYGGPTVSEALS